MERKGILYESGKEELRNFLFQLQQLEREGISLGDLPNEVWEKYTESVEANDKEKLTNVRKQLSDLIKTRQC